jgi:hypothetical protein
MQLAVQVKRSRVDLALEAVALVALLSAVALTVYYWPQIPDPRFARILPAKITLPIVTLIDVLAYAGLTLGARGTWLFDIPPELERRSPQLRQMLFSVVIVMKAVLTLFAVYLVWALIDVGLRRGGGLSGGFLTIFTIAVPLPLVFYTVKLRRYR